MKILVLTGLLFAGGALAQTTTTCNSFGQTTTCRSTAAPDYSFLHDAGKQGAEAAGQGLGALLGTALPAPRVSEIVISVRCDQVESEVIYYTNGTSMNVEIEHTALSADGRATILAKVQHVRFVNMYCEAAQNSITTMADSVAPSSHVEYRGTYECAQGTTSLSLTFDTTPNAPTTFFVFTFGPVPSNPNVPSGSFAMSGHIDMASGALDLRPVGWITHPPGFRMVGLSGTSIDGGRSISGNVVTDLPCSRFSVTKAI